MVPSLSAPARSPPLAVTVPAHPLMPMPENRPACPASALRSRIMRRNVVITGVGTVSALGVGIDALWDGVCQGRSGLLPIQRFDPSGFECRLAGEVAGFSAKDHVPKHYRKAVKVMCRDIELAIGAARCAVLDAGLTTRATIEDDAGEGTTEQAATTYPGARMGCHIGAGLIAADADELAAALSTSISSDVAGVGTARTTPPPTIDLARWGAGGMEAMTPLWLLKYLPNMLACHVTILHGCLGPSNTITCAEASGLLSIGESRRIIERKSADLCFSGGAESKVNLMGLLRMGFAGRLAATGDATSGADLVRPFDPASPGGLLGEGGGILILEAEETARARGAKVYARIAGFGAAHAPPSPFTRDQLARGHRDVDEGLADAITSALHDAGLKPTEIDAAVLLGSGVPAIDHAEAGAIVSVFGPHAANLELVPVGPNLGNCMAGTGALLAAIAAKCVKEQMLPARLNAGTPDARLRAGAAPMRQAKLRHVLVATSALGGQSAAMIVAA